MLGLDRRAASVTWTVAFLLLLLWLVYQVRRVLFLFALAVLFAFMLAPLVNWLNRVLPKRWRFRRAGLVISYVLLLGVVVGVGVAIGTKIVEQATAFEKSALARQLPEMASGWVQRIPVPQLRSAILQQSGAWASSLPKAALGALSAAGYLLYIVLVPVLAFFFLKDAGIIRQHILEIAAPGPQRVMLDAFLNDAQLLLVQYIRALVVLSLVAFVILASFLTIIGVPYAIFWGALAGLLEFVPVAGPFVAAITILVIAGVSGARVLLVLVFIACFRLFQDYVLSPQLMSQNVALHPLLVLFGVSAGLELAGIPGAFLSVPLLALAQVLFRRLRKE